jgi:hypothetical protein
MKKKEKSLIRANKKQYKIFLNRFETFYNRFCLGRWVFYNVGICEDKKLFPDGGASVKCDIVQRTFELRFYPLKTPSEKELNKIAYHEALHVLLMPLSADINKQHEVINVLERELGK